MKKFIILLIIALPFVGVAQSNFSLLVQPKKVNLKAKMYLAYQANGTQEVKTANLLNGVFKFDFNLSEPSFTVLVLDHEGNLKPEEAFKKDAFRMFIEPSKILVNFKDSIKYATVLNSKIQNEFVQFVNYTLPFDKQIHALNQAFETIPPQSRTDTAFTNPLQQKYFEISKQRTAVIKRFFNDFPNSYISLFMLNAEFGGNKMDVTIFEPLFNNFGALVKKTKLGQLISNELAAVKFTSIGSIAPNFSSKTPNDQTIQLSDFKGKYVLLDFWASWCAPCRQENPAVVSAYQKFKNKNFTVLGVSLDKTKAPWVKAIADDGLTWPNVSSLNYFYGAEATLYGIKSIPQNFLIGPDGKIIAKNLRGEELEKTLSTILP